MGSGFTMATYLDHTVLPAFALEGRFVLILYPGERKWHERLIVLRPNPSNDPKTVGWCVTATPDGDVYGEPLAPPNIDGFAVLAPDRSLPPGLLRRNVYRFEDGSIGQAPTPAELAHLRGVAQAELDALQREIDATGVGALVAAAPAAPAAAPAAAPVGALAVGPVLTPTAGSVWVVAVAEGNRAKGSLVPIAQVTAGHQAGSKAVVGLTDGSVLFVENIPNHELANYASSGPPIGSPSPTTQVLASAPVGAIGIGSGDDARTLAVRYGTDGKRRRELRDGVELASESVWGDWPIKGPRTAKWVGQYFVSNGGSPLSMHNAWKVNCKLQASDGGVLEHESICKALELAIEYDQLNIGELAAIELLCRRLQMIQFRWKERVLGASSTGTVDDESHFFLGVDPTRGNLCICPALNTWLGEELHKEAQANKEQRKAREERALLRANKPK